MYSVIDFFRDIGGAAILLIIIAGKINAIWTYNKLENSIVAQLYMKPTIIKREVDTVGKDKELKADGQSVTKELCQLFRCRGRQLCCKGD